MRACGGCPPPLSPGDEGGGGGLGESGGSISDPSLDPSGRILQIFVVSKIIIFVSELVSVNTIMTSRAGLIYLSKTTYKTT